MTLTRQISKANPADADLKLNILLMLSEDPDFLNAPSIRLVLSVLNRLFGFMKETLVDESFTPGMGEALFLLMRWCLKLRQSGNRFAEYLRMLTSFAESLAIHRGRVNLTIVYEILRNAPLFDKFDGFPSEIQSVLHQLRRRAMGYDIDATNLES
jgi:hypothetical protein